MFSDYKVLLRTLALVMTAILVACETPEEEEGGPPPPGGGSLSINCPTTVLDPGTTYNFTASGGAGDYLFTLVSGGGTLNAASGSYKAPGTGGAVTIIVKDASGAEKSCTFQVYLPVQISPTTVTMNAAETTTFTYTNGVAPFSWAVTSGGGSVSGAGVYTAPNTAGSATVRVTDGKGATSSANVTINLSPPAAFTIAGVTGGADSTADQWLNNLTPTLSWSASGAATSYDVVIKDAAGAATVCTLASTAATSYTFGCTLTDGVSYKAYVTANNGAGSTNATNNGFDFTVDQTPPAAFTITGATGGTDNTADGYLTNGTNVTANWNDTTGESSYDVSIRNAADSTDICAVVNKAANSTSHSFASCTLVNGTSYNIKVVAKDAAGNNRTVTFPFTVDSTAPVVAITAQPPDPSNSSNVSFSFTVTETGSGVATLECEIDNGGFSACTSPKNYAGLSAASHTFKVRAADNAGHPSNTASYSWTVTIAPAAPVAVDDSATVDQDSAAGVVISVLTNDTDANSDPLTVSNKTNGTYGTVTIEAGNTTVKYVPNAGFNGVDTFTYEVSDGNGGTDTGTVTVRVMNPFTWDGGGGDALWSTAANWHGNAAPNGSQVAIFDATCSANCSPTISGYINVGGIRLNSGYAGTVTKSAGIDVGSSGLTIHGGTFDDTSGAFFGIGGVFTQSGGTFNGPVGATLAIWASQAADTTVLSLSGGAFNLASTTLRLVGTRTQTYTLDVNASATVAGLQIYVANNGGHTSTFALASGDTINVSGDYSQGRNGASDAFVRINGGTIKVAGDFVVLGDGALGGTATLELNGTGLQRYDATDARFLPNLVVNKTAGNFEPLGGTTGLGLTSLTIAQGTFLAPAGNLVINKRDAASGAIFTQTGGTFTHNSGTVQLTGTGGTATYTIDVPTSLALNNLTLDTVNAAAETKTFAVAAGDTINVNGNLNVARSSGTGLIKLDGTLNIAGHLSVGPGADGGTAALTLNGTGAQTITHSGGTMPGGTFTINKASGTATLASALTLNSASQDL
ncbi:MAG TPA: Ig-like domain-containing protein, partial [Bdellovibrionales bacterium]|nr:Ig-like domain-containing protein [Bdellovibrionales bacterium]